jgi:hypothetical protein
VKGKPKFGDRAEILAGYFWVSVHDTDLESHLSRAPEAMWRLLAKALGLDFDKLWSYRSGHLSCTAVLSSGQTPLIRRRCANLQPMVLDRSRNRESKSTSRMRIRQTTKMVGARENGQADQEGQRPSGGIVLAGTTPLAEARMARVPLLTHRRRSLPCQRPLSAMRLLTPWLTLSASCPGFPRSV